MGAVFGSVAACCGSCAGACLATACCKAVSSCGGSKSSRAPHLVLMFFSVLAAILLRFEGYRFLHYLSNFDDCSDWLCIGNQAVYRFSFTLVCFFFLHFVILLAAGGTSSFHNALWPIKALAFLALLVVSFVWIPHGFFSVFADISRFVSAVFLIIQIIILVDFGYRWNEKWLAHDTNSWKVAILVASGVMLALSITLWVLGFLWFTKAADSTCGLQKAVISLTLIMAVLYTLIAISNVCEHGALLPSMVVVLYTSYLAWSALSSDPSTCNSLVQVSESSGKSKIIFQYVFGIALVALSITYSGWNVASTSDLFGKSDQDTQGGSDGSQAPLVSDANDNDDGSDLEAGQAHGGATEEKPKSQTYFHFVMAMASMYMAMLLSNWGSSDTGMIDTGSESMWVKIISQWITIALYIWTLLAPYLFPDRDFGH